MAAFILCCGMRRSASTLQYNIVSNLLEISNNGISLGFYENDVIEDAIKEHLNDKGYVAIKTHLFSPMAYDLYKQNRLKIVFSIRDIRDIFVSSMHKWYNGKFWHTYNPTYNKQLMKDYGDWTQFNNRHQKRYEDIVTDLEREILDIADYLNINIDRKLAIELADKLTFKNIKKELRNIDFQKEGVRIPAGIYDKKTLLHKDHLHSGKTEQWREELSSYEIATIQREWKSWLIDNNYPIFKTLYNVSIFYFTKKYYDVYVKKIKKFLFPLFKDSKIYSFYKKYK